MRFFKLSLAILAVCLAVSPATADLTAVLGDGHGDPFYGNIQCYGGYYQATLSGALPAGTTYTIPSSFRTFCMEDRFVYAGTQYTATIDDQVLQYGPKTLQATTANLYALYVDNAPTVGWNSITDVGSSNRALQALFWDLQGTYGAYGPNYAYSLLTPSEQTLYNAFNDYNNTHADANAANVMVLNLWDGAAYDTAGDAQSQLIMTTRPVPAPGAAVLATAGLGLIGWVRRRVA